MSSALTPEELEWVLQCVRNHQNDRNDRNDQNNRNFPAALRESATQKLEKELVVKTEHNDGFTSLVSISSLPLSLHY